MNINDMTIRSAVNRRTFLKGISTAAGAAMFPHIIPASALGLEDNVAPSERIVLGAIGIGSRGWGVLSAMMGLPGVQFVADCDVRKSQRDAVAAMSKAKYGSACATYSDIRQFLAERKDLNAVLIATGNRWHAPAAVMAMRAGLDVYCEKPGCLTMAEGKMVVDTARQCGRVYTAGCQRLSEPAHVFPFEMARSGRLGKIHTVYCDTRAGQALRFDQLPAEPEPPKEELDWDAWLGPVPWRPYNQNYVIHHYSRDGWGGFYDLAHDVAEWGAHSIAQAMAGLDMTKASPIEFEYAPRDKNMTLHLANGVKMILVREREDKKLSGVCGERFEGTEGWMTSSDTRPDQSNVSAPALLGEYKKVIGAYTAKTGRVLHHGMDFFDCIRTRREPVANPNVMYESMLLNIAADICGLLKRNLKFDLKKAEFIGDDEANRLRSRGMREPWCVPPVA
jgi:hypothetical protein